jgi:outer membrane protein
MHEFRLTRNLVTVALAAGCAVMAQDRTKAVLPVINTPFRVLYFAASQTPVQTASASPSPTGNIVALPTKIAIIAIQSAVMATKEGTIAGNALKAKYAPKQAEFEKRQADIQSLTDQLKKGAATMSPEAKDKLQRDIDGKTKSLQRDAQDTQDDSQQDMGKIFNELGDKMVQIIEQYAYQNGYAVVLDVSAQQTPVIWAAPSANITADIVTLYDQAHPGIAPAAAPKPPTAAAPKPPAPVIKK